MKGPSLPAMRKPGGVEKAKAPGIPKTPALPAGARKGGGISTLVQNRAKEANEVLTRKDVSVPIILDKTASTGDIQTHFVKHAGTLTSKDDSEVRTIIPITMNGNGVSAGNKGDTSEFGSRNIGGSAQVNNAILLGTEYLEVNHINIVVIMTDTTDETGNNRVGTQIQRLEEYDAMLLIILEQTYNGTVESLENYYRELYSKLGDNLVIASGEFDAGDLVNTFIKQKGKSEQAISDVKLGSVKGMLPGVPAKGRVSIGNKTLRIGQS